MKDITPCLASHSDPTKDKIHLPYPRRLTTVKQAAQALPFTEAALRDIIFKAHDRKNSRGERIKGNGLGPMKGVIRVGRKVLLDLDAFEAWIEKQGEQ